MPRRPPPEIAGVTHHYEQVNGFRMHYAQAGPDDGEPVVLVHGWPQHWYCWRHVIEQLSDRFRVIAIDLRGYGWSEAPDSSYSKEEFAGDIVELVDVLGLERVRLCGHDWGGFSSFIACLRAPERFRSLLAVGIVHPWTDGGFDLKTIAAAAAYQPWISMPVTGTLMQRYLPYYRAFFTVAGGNRIWDRETMEIYADTFRDPDHARAASRTYRTFLLHELPSLGRYRDEYLEVPAHMLLGEGDPITNPDRLGRGARHAAQLTIEEVEAGHFLPEERPDLIAEHLLAS